jgi:hypothetical protein
MAAPLLAGPEVIGDAFGACALRNLRGSFIVVRSGIAVGFATIIAILLVVSFVVRFHASPIAA